jgi:hypothetical protein
MSIRSDSPYLMDPTTFASYVVQCFQAYPLYPIRDAFFYFPAPTDKTVGVNCLGECMYDQFGSDVYSDEFNILANLAAWGVPALDKDRRNDWVTGVLSGWGEDYFDTSSNFVSTPPGYALGQAARKAVKAAINAPPGF